MHCKSLWINASAKCINVNVNIGPPTHETFSGMAQSQGISSKSLSPEADKSYMQGSRVQPIWSHVRPNFSRVRLTKIPGRTGASSHSRKEKKVSVTQKLYVVQQKTLPLGLYRGLNQSELVKGGPPL